MIYAHPVMIFFAANRRLTLFCILNFLTVDNSIHPIWLDGNAVQLTFDVQITVTIPVDSRVCGGRIFGICFACGHCSNRVIFTALMRVVAVWVRRNVFVGFS